ncbi:hypothetical protein WJX82_007444 [Trebouxia sp. C0006]
MNVTAILIKRPKTVTGTPDKSKTKPEDISSGKEKISIPLLKELGYFDVPIKVAAARLGLGVTTLKRICRANNVNRKRQHAQTGLERFDNNSHANCLCNQDPTCEGFILLRP